MTPEEFAELNGAYPDAPNNPTPSTTGFMDKGGFAWAGGNAESYESEWVIEAVQQNLNDKDFVDYAYSIIVGGNDGLKLTHQEKVSTIVESIEQNSNNPNFLSWIETEVFNAEIEDVSDSMAVITNKFDDMVGVVEVDDDDDDDELVEVSIQDENMNEIGSYTLDDGVLDEHLYTMMAEGKGRHYWLKDIQFQGNAALASLEGGNPFYPYEGLFTSSKAAKADLQRMLDVAKTLPEATIIITDEDTTRQYTHWNNNVEQTLANASYKWRNTFKGTKDRIGWHGFTVWLPYGKYNITYKAITKLGAESAFDRLEDEVADEYEEKGMSDEEAERIGAAVAYKQGVKKYGKKIMTEAAKKGVSAKSLVKNTEEPIVEEPAWIPAGDGHIVGQQNSAINLSPLHAEGENWIDEECVECGKVMQHRMITTVDFMGGVGCNACGGGVCESCDENALHNCFGAENTVAISELSMTLANMERELGINSEDYEDFQSYPNPLHRLSAAIALIEQEFDVKEDDFRNAENTVGTPSPTFNEDITGQDGPETEPTNSNFSAESGISWGKLFIGSAALILGGGLLANKQGWVGNADDDIEPIEDIPPPSEAADTLVENPDTGDLLTGDYEEMVVQSTGYAVPVIPMSLDGSFMGSRFQALATDRYVDYNEPGIGAHTDIAMERNTKYLTPAADLVRMDSEDCGCTFFQRIKAFFTGESCDCDEETDVKESQGVGQSPYFQMGKEPVDMDYRVIKEVSPKGLDPAAVQYMPSDWVGQTGQAYVPDSLYGTMYDLGVAGIHPSFNTPNETSTGANRMGDRMAQPDTLSNVMGASLSVGTNASYTDGGETKTLAQWGIENQVSQISDSEAVVVSHTSGVRKMIRRV